MLRMGAVCLLICLLESWEEIGMNQEQEIFERLGRIEKLERRRMVFSVFGVLLTLVIAVVLVATIARVAPMVNDVYAQIQPALGNIEEMTDSLSEVDWSQLNQLEELDIGELNQAITTLNDAVAALENAFEPIRDFVDRLLP